MTKKEFAKHALTLGLTLVGTLAVGAVSLFLILKLAPVCGSLLVAALAGASPSGVAGGGILFFSGVLLSSIASAPVLTAWFTQQALAKLCWGDADFYWSKTPMGRLEKEQAQAHQAKNSHQALIDVSQEKALIEKEWAQQNKDVDLVKEMNKKYLAPSVEKLDTLLKPAGTGAQNTTLDYHSIIPALNEAVLNSKESRQKCQTTRKLFHDARQELVYATSESEMQALDSDPLKKDNETHFGPCVRELNRVLTEASSIEALKAAIQNSQKGREQCIFRRKQFTLSRSSV